RNAQLLDRDQREIARLERIAEACDHLDADAGAAPGFLGLDEIARRGAAGVRHREFAPLLLLDALEPEAIALLPQHAEHHFLAAREPLHRVRDPARARLLGAREEAIADAERAAFGSLAHAQAR